VVVAQTRRRGGALVGAIYAAVLDELGDSGYAGLSIERVAERARTGKASIYRRWPTRLALVLDTLDHTLPQLDELPDTGSTRDDVLIVMRRIATVMRSPSGDAVRACFSPGADRELADAVRQQLLAPRKAAMLEILRRGVARGDVRADALSPRVAELGPSLLNGELMHRGELSDAAVVEIVDDVVLPLLRPR
jgi:AcrR family transcriptional regulator